jgi:tetratricopeptide (TPR) repeat protein
MRSRTPLLAAALWTSLAAHAATAPPDSWVEVRTPGFSVFSDDGEKAARRVAARLEEMQGFLLEEWPWARFAPELPIVVLAIAEGSRLSALLPVHPTRTGSIMVAGMTWVEPHRTLILLRSKVPEDRTEDNPYHVAYHEYVHAVLGRSLRLPPWLSEGLGEYWGGTRITDREVEIGRPIGTHVHTLRRLRRLPFEKLFRQERAAGHGAGDDATMVFYAQSWVLVHYLALGAPARAGQLNRLAALLSQGRAPLEATREVLGDFDALGAEIDAYVQRKSLNVRRRPRRKPVEAGGGTARRLSRAEALALTGGVLMSARLAGQGRALLEQAAALDPRLSAPAEEMGIAAFRADDPEAARRWLGIAVRGGEASFFAHHLLGTLALAEGNTGAAEADLRRALQINPEFAPALVALAAVLAQRSGAGDEALASLAGAVVRRPDDPLIRVGVAGVLLSLGHAREARLQAEAARMLDPAGPTAARAAEIARLAEAMAAKDSAP